MGGLSEIDVVVDYGKKMSGLVRRLGGQVRDMGGYVAARQCTVLGKQNLVSD
jgi:hypothetical protein